MIGNKLHHVALASALSLTALAANAVEPAAHPRTVNCSVPHYPKTWIEDEVQGTVRLSVLVGADGNVKDAQLVESSGYRLLDKASLRATANCKFEVTPKDTDSASGWTPLQFTWITE